MVMNNGGVLEMLQRLQGGEDVLFRNGAQISVHLVPSHLSPASTFCSSVHLYTGLCGVVPLC